MIKKATRRIIRNFKNFTPAEKAELILSCLSIMLFVWMFCSWAEIAFNNLTVGYEYSRMNLWIMIFDFFETATIK